MNIMDFVTKFGAIVGCISTTIALLVMIRKAAVKKTNDHIAKVADVEGSEKIRKELNERLEKQEKQIEELLRRDKEFQDTIESYMEAQAKVDKKLLASIIENTYYQNKSKRTLDAYEFRRISEVYEIYSGDMIHGNSYIKEIYDEMTTWDRV